jgi:hypothetical protein
VDKEGTSTEAGRYQVDTHLNIAPVANAAASSSKVPQLNMPSAPSSRYLLPRPAHPSPYDAAAERGWKGRTRREVVTERDLLNYQGTIYEVPRHGGIARARPITSHGKLISDFCSWRGLLVLAGTWADATPDGHYFRSKDGRAGLWFGFVEDLWHFGKPRGVGGPWKDSPVQAGNPSTAYMMTGFDRKALELSHNSDKDVTFTVEADFLATGQWHRYATFEVAPGKTVRHTFPDGYSAHWVRAITDTNCSATAWFTYD